MGSEESRSVVDVVSSGVEPQVPRQRREWDEHPVAVLGSISVGGVAGALARYGLSEIFPRDPGG